MVSVELTIPSIIASITLIIGVISKKLKLVNKKYIPIQNILIGVVSGIIVYCADLESTLFRAISVCLISSLSAGGLYDTFKIKKDGEILDEFD